MKKTATRLLADVCYGLRRHKRYFVTLSFITLVFLYYCVTERHSYDWRTPFCLQNSPSSNDAAEKATVLECEAASREYNCLCYSSNVTDLRCALTISLYSRLGNNMGEYATLYGLASLNRRPAFVLREMAAVLRRYFKITLPVLSEEVEKCIDWTPVHVNGFYEGSYARFQGRFIRLIGTPFTWKFYSHVADEIRREFTFHDEITLEAQRKLHALRANRASVTYVGLHVRRGDYVELLQGNWRGVLANGQFFKEATDKFRRRYPDSIFVVVSDDMTWCGEHLSNASGDVYFVGNNDQLRPIDDLAILANCNHTIFSIGSYGYWGAFLAGGDVIYLANYTLPDSPLNPFLHFDTVFWPQWEPIAADLSDFGQ